MRPEVEQLFHEIADLSPEERERFLESRKVPAEIRHEVHALLEHDDDRDVLSQPLAEVAGATLLRFALSGEHPRCGAYELHCLLGSGGMGSVYRARRADGEIAQEVAVKVLRPGLAEANLHQRFLQERQILASLSHPNIARLLDAGRNSNGQPYLVMEFVDGVPLDTYCANLSVRERIEIFLLVCEAVSCAHRNLIIHRDLKPANILVGADGQPKLLDFGLAKILELDTSLTRTEHRALTPDYASPEQVTGAPPTTATDIYSLGALLYRLLAGRSPHQFEGRSAESIIEVICLQEPPPASRFEPACEGDLDAILKKALRKEPGERYGSVEQMAEDLRSYLASRPIRLRQDEMLYRMRKFIRRRWLPVTALAVALASLSSGLVIAHRERTLAERRFRQVRDLANSLFYLDEKVRKLQGSTEARQAIIETSLRYLDRLSQEVGNDPELMVELATAYQKTASVLGRRGSPSLGKFEDAQRALVKADGMLRAVLARDPGNRTALRHFISNETDLMSVIGVLGHYDGESQRRALALEGDANRLISGEPSAEDLDAAANAYMDASRVLLNGVALGEARRLADRGLDCRRRYAKIVRTPEANYQLATALRRYGTQLRYDGELDRAVALLEEARSIVDGLPETTQVLIERSNILYYLGVVSGEIDGLSLGRYKEGAAHLAGSLEICRKLIEADPKDTNARLDFANAALKLGRITALTEPAKALAIFDEGARVSEAIAQTGERLTFRVRFAGDSTSALRAMHRFEEARERIDRVIGELRVVKDYPFTTARPTGTPDVVLRAQAELETAAGNWREAIRIREETIRLYEAAKIHEQDDLQHAFGLSAQWRELAMLHRKLGQVEQARVYEAKRLAFWKGWNERHPGNQFVQSQLATAQKTPHGPAARPHSNKIM